MGLRWFAAWIRSAAVFIALAFVLPLEAQQQDLQPIGEEKLTAFAKAYSNVAEATLEFQFALARAENKTFDAQARLHEAMMERTSEIVQEQGLTVEEYVEITFLVSTNEDHRNAFEASLAALAEDQVR